MPSNRHEGASHLGVRAGLAVALLLGFYLLAAILVLGLLGLAVLLGTALIVQVRMPGFVAIAATAGMVGGAAGLLRGVLGGLRSAGAGTPLGIATTPTGQPWLWAEVRDLAGAAGAPVPAEIHLVPGVTAFVYQESRWLGLVKGKVVLGVGLGLLGVVERDGLRAVLAHEFGHISGGDTRLGPMIHRSQLAIQRTVEVLEHDEKFLKRMLARVFRAYFRLFWRSTMTVSRAQERAADRASVRVAGAEATCRALETIGVADTAFDFFVDRYVVPLLRRGRWATEMYSGFRDFYTEPARQDELARVRTVVLTAETGRWDSHPSIGERIRLIEGLSGAVTVEPPGELAWHLLDAPEETEREMALIVARSATGGASGLEPITWDEAAAELGAGMAGGGAALGSAAIAVGGQWDRTGLDQALELLAAGRGAELARELDLADPQALRGPLRAALAADVVERHGGTWTASWAGVGADWPGTPIDELTRRAMSGTDGIAEVRAELGIPGAPLRSVPPLHVTTGKGVHA